MKYIGKDNDQTTIFTAKSCECGCLTGGKCQHVWNATNELVDSIISAKCSRCGMLAVRYDDLINNVIPFLPFGKMNDQPGIDS